jgi:hypothetical protein
MSHDLPSIAETSEKCSDFTKIDSDNANCIKLTQS